jgi:hypothetical protein
MVKKPYDNMGLWIAMGIIFGVVIGTATDQLGMWIAIGVAMGTSFGAAFSARGK